MKLKRIIIIDAIMGERIKMVVVENGLDRLHFAVGLSTE